MVLVAEHFAFVGSVAEAEGQAARLYVESAAGVLAQRLLSLGRRPSTPPPGRGLAPSSSGAPWSSCGRR